MSVHAVILCGGRGERFWPKSRRRSPKQFINLFGKRSLTQETSDRIRALCPFERQLFVAPYDFERVLRRQFKLSRANLAFEPMGRNTAPAIGLAAAYLGRRDRDALMVVLPADHLIVNRKEFVRAVRLAVRLAQDGLLVTFGIPPDRPDTGYGYVQLGEALRGVAGQTGGLAAHRVLGFREKPDKTTAERYVAAGDYVWNSGMFVWRVDAILDAFRRFLPEFHSALRAFQQRIGTPSERRALAALYRTAPAISIDYAVMEKAENIAAVRATFDWDDLGSWLALARHVKPDRAGNVVNGAFIGRDAADCIVDSDAGLVAVMGVSDLVVVRSGDAVFVTRKDALGAIKDLLADISRDPRTKGSL